MAAHSVHRIWTAVISVQGYNPMTATWSEHDQHDDQIMHAAHEALRSMTATRFRPVPGMTPAEGAPPKVMISSEGTGMHADSAAMSSKMAT